MHDGLFQHRGGQSPAGEVLLATVLDEAPGDVVAEPLPVFLFGVSQGLLAPRRSPGCRRSRVRSIWERTGGGVWKTTDGGETWFNITDGQFATGSVGAVGVADSNPNVIYVGTGSACIRGNVSPGVGIYKSTDAGRSWSHAGLDDAGQIGRVIVHPTDPDIV